jgi:hypothetical protein
LWRALEDGTCHSTNGTDPFIIKTLEGEMTVSPGDWIIQGVNGELYPCKPDIFEKTYEPVEERAEVGDWVIQGVNGEIRPCKPDIFEKTYEPAKKDGK